MLWFNHVPHSCYVVWIINKCWEVDIWYAVAYPLLIFILYWLHSFSFFTDFTHFYSLLTLLIFILHWLYSFLFFKTEEINVDINWAGNLTAAISFIFHSNFHDFTLVFMVFSFCCSVAVPCQSYPFFPATLWISQIVNPHKIYLVELKWENGY